MTKEKTKMTPPELAARWGVAPEKILHFIRSGELQAIDVALVRGGKPRYLIDVDAIADFEARRAVTAPLPTPRRRRKPTTSGITRHFR